jgi:hypothetical protein
MPAPPGTAHPILRRLPSRPGQAITCLRPIPDTMAPWTGLPPVAGYTVIAMAAAPPPLKRRQA